MTKVKGPRLFVVANRIYCGQDHPAGLNDEQRRHYCETYHQVEMPKVSAIVPSCTCGALEFEGCLCNITFAEFRNSPHVLRWNR